MTEHSFVIPFNDLSGNADTFCSAEVFFAANATVTRIVPGTDTGGGKWVNTINTSGDGFGANLRDSAGTIVGFMAAFPADGSLDFELSMNNTPSARFTFLSANIFVGACGSFTNPSPLQYGVAVAGNGSSLLTRTVALPNTLFADVVTHAIICPQSTNQ